MGMRTGPLIVTAAVLLALTGCVPDGSHSATSPTPSATPVFASDAEALAAAEKAYAAYESKVDLSLQAVADAGLATVATGDALESALASVESFRSSGRVQRGVSQITKVKSADLSPLTVAGRSNDVAQIYACLDVSAVSVLDSTGIVVSQVGRQTVFPTLVSLRWGDPGPESSSFLKNRSGMAQTSAARRALLLGSIGLAVVAPLVFLPALPAIAANCTPESIRLGTCSVDAAADASQVTIVGSVVTPGSRGTRIPDIGSRGRGQSSADKDVCAIPRGNRCFAIAPRPATPAVASAATPSITLRDLASFRPAPGSQNMEPNGWVVPGLDANFYAIVGQQLVPGTLLGQPATVRFTPVGYHWNYGDGSAAFRPTKGDTWARLGLRDFDPTPTSHVYETEGDYVIQLAIDFRAEYQFGSARVPSRSPARSPCLPTTCG